MAKFEKQSNFQSHLPKTVFSRFTAWRAQCYYNMLNEQQTTRETSHNVWQMPEGNRKCHSLLTFQVIHVGNSRREEKHWRFHTFPIFSCRVTFPHRSGIFPPKFYLFIITQTSMSTELLNIINKLPPQDPKNKPAALKINNTAAQLEMTKTGDKHSSGQTQKEGL